METLHPEATEGEAVVVVTSEEGVEVALIVVEGEEIEGEVPSEGASETEIQGEMFRDRLG